jgi:predicted nicotinamide N-methyase
MDCAAFIAAETRPVAPPLVPEIRLYLASEITSLWQATEASLRAANLPPPYWAFAWPGGQALARFVLDHPDRVRGRRVLDLAAGSGLAAIAAAKAGALVTAADIDPMAASAMALNAALNGAAIAITSRDLTQAAPALWDVVLAGDVCYERPMATQVLSWLERCAEARASVLLGDPGRAYLPGSGLEEIARYEVPTSLDLEDRPMRVTRVLRLMRGAR